MSNAEERPDEIRYPDGRIEHPTVKREERDVWTGGVFVVLVVCLIIGAIDIFVVWHFFKHNETEQAAIKASHYPLAATPSLTLPAEPRLDPLNRISGNEQANVYQMEASDLKQLNQTGLAAEKGFAHIPIAEAMKIVVGRLPVRKQPDPAAGKDNGLRFGGEPNSGRMFEEVKP